MQKKAFKKVIKGKRITLKKQACSIKHAEVMYSIVDRNREHLLPWLNWVYHTKKPEDTYDFLKMKEEEWDKKESALYGIYLKDKFIGTIDMMNISHKKDSGEIGYWLDCDYAGKGYMTEAVTILENEFFEYGMNRILIRCDEDNLASKSVIEKNNYTFEGISRQTEVFEERTEGEYRNHRRYSKLYHEWKHYKK